MTAELPPLDPALAVDIGELPERLRRRAEKLTGDRPTWQVSTSDGVTSVVIGKAILRVVPPDEVSCDCLLAPDCAHRAALITASPIADSSSATIDVDDPETTADRPTPSTTLDDRGRAASQVAATALLAVLDLGLGELTVSERAQVMRAVHLCRNAGLHRLAATLVATHSTLAATALRQAVLAVHELRRADAAGTVGVAEIGTARRHYGEVGNLRLHGVATEPVSTASGYAGVVTTLVDANGLAYTLNSIRPGDLSQVSSAYRTAPGLGDLVADHLAIGRGQLLVGSATVSADGRLGAGRGVRASMSEKPSAPPELPHGIVDVAVTVSGVEPRADTAALLVTTEAGRLLAVEPVAAAVELGALRMLRTLARYPGTAITVRLRGTEVLAIRVDPQTWDLDPRLHGWVQPGLDTLPDLDPSVAPSVITDSAATNEITPGEILARWATRVAVAGRKALLHGDAQVRRDIAWLRDHASGHRADALETLTRVARKTPGDPTLLTAWLAVMLAAGDLD